MTTINEYVNQLDNKKLKEYATNQITKEIKDIKRYIQIINDNVICSDERSVNSFKKKYFESKEKLKDLVGTKFESYYKQALEGKLNLEELDNVRIK